MIIDKILIEAKKSDASDAHVVCVLPPILRVHGDLVRLEQFGDVTPEISDKILKEILNDNQKKLLEEQKAVDFSYALPNVGRFRCSYYYQRGSLAGAFRLISHEILSLKQLGLPQQVEEFAFYPRGLVLVTGPTGSGKSTTLAAIINIINQRRALNIITVEDPIEYLFNHNKSIISQREILADARSFRDALRYVLREDPDVIMVGEMRDLETISSALTAAETGHLVFSTLHTQDAAQTIDRIIDIFPTHQQRQIRTQLAGTLKGVLVQQLLPNIQKNGRVAATELMFVNNAISNMIREDKSYQIGTAMQSSGKRGMITMDSSLVSLYRAGKISKETAIDSAHNREEVIRLIGS